MGNPLERYRVLISDKDLNFFIIQAREERQS